MCHPLIQFSEICLTRPTDLGSLISEPANRPGFACKDTVYIFREKVLLGLSKRWGSVVPAWVSVILLGVEATTLPKKTFSFS